MDMRKLVVVLVTLLLSFVDVWSMPSLNFLGGKMLFNRAHSVICFTNVNRNDTAIAAMVCKCLAS